MLSVLLLAGFGCDSSYVQKLMPPSPPMEAKISSPDVRQRPDTPAVAFGQELMMSLHTKVSYRDGLVMEVTKVADTRCAAGAKCDAPGKAAVTVQLSGGLVGAMPKEVILSLPDRSMARESGYVLFLGSMTGTTAAITLSKEHVPSSVPETTKPSAARPLPPKPPVSALVQKKPLPANKPVPARRAVPKHVSPTAP